MRACEQLGRKVSGRKEGRKKKIKLSLSLNKTSFSLLLSSRNDSQPQDVPQRLNVPDSLPGKKSRSIPRNKKRFSFKGECSLRLLGN